MGLNGRSRKQHLRRKSLSLEGKGPNEVRRMWWGACHHHNPTAKERGRLISRLAAAVPRAEASRAPPPGTFLHRKWPRGIRIPGACFVSTRPPKIRTGAGKRCFHRAGFPLNGQPQAKRRDMGGTQRPCQRPAHPNRMSLHHGQLAGCSLLSH